MNSDKSGSTIQSGSNLWYLAHTRSTGLGLWTRDRWRAGELVIRMKFINKRDIFFPRGQLDYLYSERLGSSFSTREDRTIVSYGSLVHRVERRSGEPPDHENWIGLGNQNWFVPEPRQDDHTTDASRMSPLTYINHACDPNLAYGGLKGFVAIRDIEAGEELTFDYATSQDESWWSMRCRCRSPRCRRIIRAVCSLPERMFLRCRPHSKYFRRVWLANRKLASFGFANAQMG